MHARDRDPKWKLPRWQTRLQSRRIVIAVNVLLNSVLSLLLAGALFTASAQGGALIVAASVPQAVPRHVGAVGIDPDSVVTPAAPNPAVTPDNIKDNICNRHWSTRLVRPASGYTSRPKRKQLREYEDTVHQTRTELINRITGEVDVTRCVAHSDDMARYEEDHLISLEIGGHHKTHGVSGRSLITPGLPGPSWALGRRILSRATYMTRFATTFPASKRTPTYQRLPRSPWSGDRRFWPATGMPAIRLHRRGDPASEGTT